MPSSLVILGEYDPGFTPHQATETALQHSSASLGQSLDWRWVSTQEITPQLMEAASGLWVAPGSPYRDLANTLVTIRIARETGIPTLGTCGGFQHMILEYARNLLGFHDAQHAEYDPYASRLFIHRLKCSLFGREMELRLTEESLAARCYGRLTAREEYYCNFGINPEYLPLLQGGPFLFTGADQQGDARILEFPAHPFFVGTLFVPQMRSSATKPHPLVTAFLRAILR